MSFGKRTAKRNRPLPRTQCAAFTVQRRQDPTLGLASTLKVPLYTHSKPGRERHRLTSTAGWIKAVLHTVCKSNVRRRFTFLTCDVSFFKWRLRCQPGTRARARLLTSSGVSCLSAVCFLYAEHEPVELPAGELVRKRGDPVWGQRAPSSGRELPWRPETCSFR